MTTHSFYALDAFTQGYIEAMFYTDASPDAEENIRDKGFTDLADGALNSIVVQCKEFQDMNRAALEAAYNDPRVQFTGATFISYNESCAGHDFWLTRNHHGAGFWDRDLGMPGDELTRAAHQYGEVSLYCGDDGLLYCM